MNYKNDSFLNLSNKVVLVTGANGQLGLSLVKTLIQYKANVVAVDIKISNVKKLKNIYKISDDKLMIIKNNIDNENEVRKVFSKGLKSLNS